MIQFKKITKKSKRIGLSGKGGCGKSYAITYMYKHPIIFDMEQKWSNKPPFTNFPVVDIGSISYDNLMRGLIGLLNEPKLEGYDAIIIDTLSEVENLCISKAIDFDYKGNKNKYSAYSSGDNNELPQYFGEFLRVLQDIQAKHDIDILLICHAAPAPVSNPMGDDYTKITLDLKKKVQAKVLKWLDFLGVVYDDVEVVKEGLKTSLTGSKRMISFDSTSPFFDAKSIRSDITPTIPFDIKGEWVKKILN